MGLYESLKEATACFLRALLGQNPSYRQLNRAVIRMPQVRAVNHYPQPGSRKSGVAAAKRAARRRKAKK